MSLPPEEERSARRPAKVDTGRQSSCKHERRLRRDCFPNLRWGAAHASVPNNILSSVVGCARKYEQSKNGAIKKLFSEIGVFLVKKGSYMTFHTIKIWKNVTQKSWSAKYFPSPKLGARSRGLGGVVGLTLPMARADRGSRQIGR